ncbi:MAG: fumarylacetoacetate hydrolase family protein [Pirellulaceae bacterium]|nr:fumarylacetoacetate hydrolase family protein [Planctomycetales bacterium]
MRLAQYYSSDDPSNGKIRLVAIRDGQPVELAQVDPRLPRTLRQWLIAGQDVLAATRQACAVAPVVDVSTWRLLPPIHDPEKIFCVGLNYADHARETNAAIPTEPCIFNKFPTTLRAHGDPIVLPTIARQVDFEAELVVVIGREGRNIARDHAFDYVAGYACGHDVSARDWQKTKPGGQWLLGKSFDSFGPLGPHFVSADEVPDPHDLKIEMRLNDQLMQSSNTREMIFRIDVLIEYLSAVATLKPGDLIFTGTPAGVGVARKPQVFLQPGDVADVSIEGIGLLKNPVVAQEFGPNGE